MATFTPQPLEKLRDPEAEDSEVELQGGSPEQHKNLQTNTPNKTHYHVTTCRLP